jgi:energy-coupling factor transport system ATP-binding protein
VIDVQNVQFRYSPGSEFSLRGVSFGLRPGETVALMGANGSGKTTLIRCLNGLLIPESGNVVVDGLSIRDAGSLVEIRRRVGLVFQNPDDQIVTATVDREIAFGLENLGVPHGEMVARVEDALDRFHLRAFKEHSPHLLSGGERQRLALAAVWVMDPGYFVLDEPTSLLDPSGRRDIHRFMAEKASSRGNGFLLATQFPEEAMLCGRLIVLDGGRVVYDGKPEIAFRDAEGCRRWGIGIPASVELEAYAEGVGLGPST